MDSIPFDELISAFSKPLAALVRSSQKQEEFLNEQFKKLQDIQNLLGDQLKNSALNVFQKNLNEKLDELIDLAKPDFTNKQDEKAEKTGGDEGGLAKLKLVSMTDSTPTSLKALPVRVLNKPDVKTKEETKPKTALSPLHHDEVNVLLPPETRVFLENLLGDSFHRLIEAQNNNFDKLDKLTLATLDVLRKPKEEKKKSWLEQLMAFLLGEKFLSGILGKLLSPLKFIFGTIPKMLFEIGKMVIPLISRLLGPVMPILAGAGLAIAGVMTLINGLQDSGPYKGTKKIIGKGLLEGGIALLKREFGKLSKLATEVVADASGGIIGTFKNIGARLIEGITGFFGKIGNGFKSLFGGTVAKEGVEVISKGAGKGLVSTFLKSIGEFFKKVPLIGSIISIGFAISRFMGGDVVGGGIEVLSALTGLLYLVPGGAAFAFPLSLGLDGLNAFLDIKSGGATGKQTSKKLDLLFGWIPKLGAWIYGKIKGLPLIGPMINAVTAIASGNWEDTIKYLGEAFYDTPLGAIVGLFTKTETGKAVVATVGDWIGGVGSWIYDKVKDIPVIGSLFKAGDALMHGKWDDVLGYLGEFIEPLQYIGKLIEQSAESVAPGAVSDIKDFFSTIKDSLMSAVLNMLPESILGVSIRARVAQMLGVKGFGEPVDDTKTKNTAAAAQSKTEQKPEQSTTSKAWNWVTGKSEKDNKPTANVQSADNTQAPSTPPIVPVEPPSTAANTDNTDTTSDSMDNMSDSLEEHSGLLRGLIEYQKQTAANTKMLLNAMAKMNTGSSMVNVNNVNNTSANFTSDLASSTAFRQAILQR